MRLTRTPLVAYRSAVVTPDTAEALRMMEDQANKLRMGIRIAFHGVPRHEAVWDAPAGPTGYPPHLSLWPAGREVRLRVHLTDFKGSETAQREAEVAVLWGLVIPLGFTPWLRYPVPGPGDEVFHFLGPWQTVYDHLCGEGRGELAWSSVCAAAQVDVGSWYGTKKAERFVQAQLHRLGHHCGPVDGQVGDRTMAALRALGVQGSLDEAAVALAAFEPPQIERGDSRHGHVLVPGEDVSVVAYGGVAATRTKQGVSLTVSGPGKVIISIGQEV